MIVSAYNTYENMFLALDAFWDMHHDDSLGGYLSDANPYLFKDQKSADPAIWDEFLSAFQNRFDNKEPNRKDAYGFVVDYLAKVSKEYSEFYPIKKSFDEVFIEIAPLKRWNKLFEIEENDFLSCKICPHCGGELIEHDEKNTIGLKCKECDFSIVSPLNPLKDYPYNYQITVKKPASMSADKYKALSKFSGLNYLQLKNAPIGEKYTGSFNIYNAWKMMEFLDEFEIEHKEEPKFPFSSRQEMKEKLMLDDF